MEVCNKNFIDQGRTNPFFRITCGSSCGFIDLHYKFHFSAVSDTFSEKNIGCKKKVTKYHQKSDFIISVFDLFVKPKFWVNKYVTEIKY